MLERSSEYRQASAAGASAGLPSPAMPDGNERAVDLREMARIIRRRWWTIAASVATLVVLALCYLIAATPLYTATSTILIDPRKENVLENQAVLSSFGIDDAAVESQVLLIQSSAVAHRVVGTLKLAEDSEFGLEPSIANSIRETRGDAAADVIRSLSVEALQRRLKVTRQGTTFLVDVNASSQDPVKAAKISNAVTNSYLLEQIRTKYDATKMAGGWLDQQIQDMRSRVVASEKAVEDFRAANNLVASQGVMVNDQQITDLNNKLIEARVQTAEARAKLEQVDDLTKGGRDPGAIAEALASEVIARLRTQYAEIAKSEAELRTKYGAQHPLVATIGAQRRDTQRLINQEVQRILDGTRHAYEVAHSREMSLQKTLEGLKGVSGETGQAQVKLRELQREADANRALFESFLARSKETSAQESMQRPDSRIVTVATLPLVTSYPKKKLVLGLSVLLGLGLGCVLAFLVDFLDHRIKTVSQIEELSRLPSLAAIPLIGPRELARRAKRGRAELEQLHREHAGMLPPALQPPLLRYAIEEPGSIFAEQIRTIRVALHQTARDGQVNVVMVASSVPGEGKSTLASNLALAFATLGVETVLVDADLRNPQLTLGLCPRAQLGVFDVALGHATLDDALVFDEATGLAVLPSPTRRYDAAYADFTSASGMQVVLDRLRQRFSLIIVDTPPLAALVDGRVLAAQADRILFVAAWNRTPTEVVKRGLDLLAPVYDRVLGTVLTQVDLDQLQHYDYYRSSAHLRSYPYYYQQPGRERAA